MEISPLHNWSFKYTYNGAVFSQDIIAATKEEAEGRIKALANATAEGIIIPDACAIAEMQQLSA